MEEIIVIVGYKPKQGKAEALRQLMREHLPVLKQQNLVTDRVSIMMEAKDGTIIEVFGWRSGSAIEQAHTNPAVLKMWEKYAEVCDFVPVGKVEETANLFSEFTPFS
jgi:quinol monooxygenase YgiN